MGEKLLQAAWVFNGLSDLPVVNSGYLIDRHANKREGPLCGGGL